jgi:hypothetical protein
VRLAAYSLSTLSPAAASGKPLDTCTDALRADIDAFRSWYFSLADGLANRTAIPAPDPGDYAEDTKVARCVGDALAAGGDSLVGPALDLLWASQHLENLRQLEAELIQPARELSSSAPTHLSA